jgi:hypothetical protein
MRRAWLIGVATVILSWQAQGDEPKKKYQIVSPGLWPCDPKSFERSGVFFPKGATVMTNHLIDRDH